MGKFKFKCYGCGTNYSSSTLEPPPSPRWDDGHVCNPVLQEDVTVKQSIYNPNTH